MGAVGKDMELSANERMVITKAAMAAGCLCRVVDGDIFLFRGVVDGRLWSKNVLLGNVAMVGCNLQTQ